MNKYKNKKLEAGFTLLELLVVISIIGLLASIILVNLTSARKRARDVKRVADIRTIQTALEDYYGKNGKYPTYISDLVTGGQLPNEPKDPLAISTCTTPPTSASSDVCGYYYASFTPTGAVGPQSYHLGASLEDTTSQLLNQDRDCNSITGTGCPFVNPYSTTPFNGADTASCSGATGRACYDIAQ